MVNYIGELIIFLAALVAIKGGTWDKNKSGIKKLTITGLIIMVLAFLGFVISLIITYQSNEESKIKSMQLAEAVSNTQEARERAKILELQLGTMEVQLDAYKTILETVRVESERQPQQVMAQYVRLRPFDIWEAPNEIYGGSIIKFYGFRNNLLLIYGEKFLSEYQLRMTLPHDLESSFLNNDALDLIYRTFGDRVRQQIIMPSMSRHSEIAIVGRSGRGMQWAIINFSDRECDGKVFVESTPRIRSADWSWLEEAALLLKNLPESGKVKVSCDLLNLRKGPGINYPVIGFLRCGETITVQEKRGLWLRVLSDKPSEGWVFGRYVEILKDETNNDV